MKVFIVHFKNKQSKIYRAYSYRLKDGRYFFHKKENQTDDGSFALASEVVGIDEQDHDPIGIVPGLTTF